MIDLARHGAPEQLQCGLKNEGVQVLDQAGGEELQNFKLSYRSSKEGGYYIQTPTRRAPASRLLPILIQERLRIPESGGRPVGEDDRR